MPLGLLGAAVLIALLGAYLSDCIPGFGSGGKLGTPSETPASAPSKSPTEPSAAADRIAITVQGDQCRRGDAEPEPCARVCASLDRTHAATVAIDLEATEGRHGTVEELRTCLREAGFARVRIISE
jgi:hypothetical protein